MLSKQVWRDEAERAAARKFGENNAGWFIARRFLAGPLGLLVLAGGLGWAAWWVWQRATAAIGSGLSWDPPLVFGVLVAFLGVASMVAFRPRARVVPAHITILKLFVFGLLWLGVLAYAVGLLV